MPEAVVQSPAPGLAFTYRWDFGEHVRLQRALMQHHGRSGGRRWIFRALLIAMTLVVTLALLGSGSHWRETLRSLAPWLALFALWMGLLRWGLPYYSAWSYRRTNACVDHDMTRAVSPAGIQLRCHTTATDLRWEGVLRATETPEFFLFFVSSNCAVQLPKRAISTNEQLIQVRQVVQAALGPKQG
jgi:hypothetical protein